MWKKISPFDWSGFYAIVDIDSLEKSQIISITQKLLSVSPVALQLRAKQISSRVFLSFAEKLCPLCQQNNVPFIVNDRADIAALSGAWGVHLGQEDLPIKAVKTAFPHLKVGVSTHTIEQVNNALQNDADYLGFGPVFDTASKKNPDPIVGVSLLQQAIKLAEKKKVSVVAIGGISRNNILQLAKTGVQVVTAISDVLKHSNPEIAAHELADTISKGFSR